MSKLRKGQTSKGIEEKSKAITLCIKEKARLLRLAITDKAIPSSLVIENNKLTLSKLYQWTDTSLGIFKFSANTADKPKNEKFRDDLKIALMEFNQAIKSGKFLTDQSNAAPKKSSYKTRADLEQELKESKSKVEELNKLAVQLYRSYAQLKWIVEQENISITAHREAILKQAEILSQERLSLINE